MVSPGVSEHVARVVQLGLPSLPGRFDAVLSDDLPHSGGGHAEVGRDVDDRSSLRPHVSHWQAEGMQKLSPSNELPHEHVVDWAFSQSEHDTRSCQTRARKTRR